MSIIPDYGDAKDPKVRARYGRLESTVSLTGNIALFLAKLLLGLSVSSVAILGDSLNHATDVAVSVIMIYSFILMVKPPDEEHPYGHGRAEPILAVVVSTLIISMGIIVIYEGACSLFSPAINATISTVFLMLAFSGVKFAMGAFALAVNRKAGSTPIRADAMNHLSDALISASVAAGVFITISSPALRFLDPVFAIGIGLFVVVTGIRLVRESSGKLMGEADDKTRKQVMEIANSVKGVLDAHNIEVHDYGALKTISLHISVDESKGLGHAHEVSEELEEAIRKALKTRPTVHVDPTKCDGAGKDHARVRHIVASFSEVISSHGVSVSHTKDGEKYHMHVLVDSGMSVKDSHALVHRMKAEVERDCPGITLDIHLEPCEGTCRECGQECGRKDT